MVDRIKQYHHSVNKKPGAEEKFKGISAAYEVRLLLFLEYSVQKIVVNLH